VGVSGKSSAEQDWMVEKRMVEKVIVSKGSKAKQIRDNLMLLMTKKEPMIVDMGNRMVMPTGDKGKYRTNMDNNYRNKDM
jgi:hypothetical protein